MHRTIRTLSLVMVVGLVTPLLAGEGRTPIWEPITITQPGKYIVTRNIQAPSGAPAIDIVASNVDIDLNGFVLVGGTVSVVRAVNTDGILLRNGVISGGTIGVEFNGASQVVIDDLEISGAEFAGIYLRTFGTYRITRNRIVNLTGQDNGGIVVEVQLVPGSQGPGLIQGNTVDDSAGGIRVFDGKSVTVRGDAVDYLTESVGILLERCSGCAALDNTVTNSSDAGIRVEDCFGCRVVGNIVSDSLSGDGIDVATGSSGSHVAENTVSNCQTGISVRNSSSGQFEHNVLSGNASWGLHFDTGASNNTYGRNTARGNAGVPPACAVPVSNDFCDDGAGNSSFGDNFMPSLF